MTVEAVQAGAVRFRRRNDRIVYAEARDGIRDGDIVLFRGLVLGSRLIRLATRSPYSHAGLVAWWDDRLMVLEAKLGGVAAARLSHIVERYHGRAELWTARPDVELNRHRVVDRARLELGKAYSVRKVLAFLWRSLLRAADRDPRVSPDDYMCSEFVSAAWACGGVDLCPNPDYLTTPRDISRCGALLRVGRLVAEERVP